MKLQQLLAGVGAATGSVEGQVEVAGICLDSRKIAPGDLFLAVRGSRQDGNDWADQALASGAVAVLTDRPDQQGRPGRILVQSVSALAGPLCRELSGRPDEGWPVVAVTGTNGKTSSAYLAEAVLAEAGWSPALTSTVAMRFPGQEAVSSMTTPDAVELWSFLAKARLAGARSLVLETSSHALSQGRIAGIAADAAIFTNLTRDHLDYHGSMEEYYQAKKTLFGAHLKPGGVAVVNADDPWGQRLAMECGARVAGISTVDSSRGWLLRGLRCSLEGNRFELVSAGGRVLELTSPLVGEVFARNLAGVAVASLELGIAPEKIQAAARRTTVPGRCQVVRVGARRAAVDYAHTPDALERLLSGLRPLVAGRLVCVFGCGGDRDRGKRPLMGEIAARLADLAVVTSDNPRTEDPESILEEVCAGIPASVRFLKEADRRQAIRLAAEQIGPDDFLVVAGKGHEDYQITRAGRSHFDDVEEVRLALGGMNP